MLTRCPECSTSFRVTAEQLRLAEGAVRCGNCEAIFDALTTLSEDQPGNAVGQTPGGHGGVESTEDRPSGAADPDSGDPSTIGSVDYDQLSGQLSGYFGETDAAEKPGKRPVERGPATAEETVPSAPKPQAGSESPGSEQSTRISAESGTADWPVADETDDATGTTDEEGWLKRLFDEDHDDAPVFVVEGETSTTSQPEDDYGPGPDKVADLGEYVEYSQDPFPQSDVLGKGETVDPGIPGWQDLAPTSDSRDRPRNGVIANNRLWTIGSVVLLITLLVQLVHNNRDALATHGRYGETVRAVYSLLSMPLYPEWDLRAYEIRGSEAVSGESQAGALDIRAQMMIKGTEAVGEPLLRILLRDRWSNLVARGVFTASEYRSDGTSAGSLLRPGNLLPISISVDDPGDAAQGYELHLCVMTRHAGLKCDRKAGR